MCIKLMKRFGYSGLIVNHVKIVFQTKHPKLRQYKNEFIYIFTNFLKAIYITSILKEVNHRDDNLAGYVVAFGPPIVDHFSYSIEVF